MSDSNKIDLKEVNKTKKSLKLPKFSNPFKKQKGPKRDEVGKFAATTGSGGLSLAKNINARRALPLIAVVALVGGFFVFQSFAANTNGTFVTEMYQRCYNQMISSGSGYDYWLGRLNGGESRNSVWSAYVAASGKPCDNPYPPASANTTPAPVGTTTGNASMNAQQVTALYQELLGRAPSQADIDYWVNRSRTMTPEQVRAHIDNTDEAFKKNIAKKVAEAQAWKALADAHVTNAKKENEATYKISLQEQITRADLDTIAKKEKYVRDAINQIQSGAATVGQNYQRAIKLNLSQVGEFKNVVNSLSASSQALNVYLQNIGADYKRAEQKYESLLTFYNVTGRLDAERIRCQANGGTWQWWRNYCAMPVPTPVQNTPGSSPAVPGCPTNINASSSRDCIRQLQDMMRSSGFYTGAIDGLWGNLTSQAFYRWRGSLNPGSGGTGSRNPVTQPVVLGCGNGYVQRGSSCVQKYVGAKDVQCLEVPFKEEKLIPELANSDYQRNMYRCKGVSSIGFAKVTCYASDKYQTIVQPRGKWTYCSRR